MIRTPAVQMRYVLLNSNRAFPDLYYSILKYADSMIKVLNGVSFFQTQNITHGNISSQNVLLSWDGVVKIANLSTGQHESSPRNAHISALGLLCMEMMERNVLIVSKMSARDTLSV
jgi:serine/threonine protein kinase